MDCREVWIAVDLGDLLALKVETFDVFKQIIVDEMVSEL